MRLIGSVWRLSGNVWRLCEKCGDSVKVRGD